MACRLNCRQVRKILTYKPQEVARLKNRLIFCDGQFVSSTLTQKSYDSVPEVFYRWIKKYKRKYIFYITHQSLSMKKNKYLMNFYLLSNDVESKAILSKKQKLEFSGQIVQRPVLLDKNWHFLVLREETAIKIE